MTKTLSPIVSEFETTSNEANYNDWLKTKTSKSLSNTSPSIPHVEVMAEIETIITTAEAKHRKMA